MKIIKENKTNKIEIKKSKFITFIYNVETEEQIKNILKDLKKQYKDATHHTYAYILENTKKCSDDKEPTNTAGLPMLGVLTKNDLTNTLVVTIRYFGGIKLGAGGLIRAYTKSVTEILKLTSFEEYIKYEIIKIKIPYENKDIINKIINEKEIIKKEFDKEIIITIKIEQTKKEELLKKLDNLHIEII